jgi:hypothetical protein
MNDVTMFPDAARHVNRDGKVKLAFQIKAGWCPTIKRLLSRPRQQAVLLLVEPVSRSAGPH